MHLLQAFDPRALTEFLQASPVIRQAIILECTPKGKHACQRFEPGSSPSVWLTGTVTNYQRTVEAISRICREGGRVPSFPGPKQLRIDSKQYVQRIGPFCHLPKDGDSARGSTGFHGGSHSRARGGGPGAGPVPGSSSSAADFDIQSVSTEAWYGEHPSLVRRDREDALVAALVHVPRIAELPSVGSVDVPPAAMSVGSVLPSPPSSEPVEAPPPMPIRPALLEGWPLFIVDDQLLGTIRHHATPMQFARLVPLASSGVLADPRFVSDDVGEQLEAVVEVVFLC